MVDEPTPNDQSTELDNTESVALVVPVGEDPHLYVPTMYVGKIPPNRYCRGWNSKREHYCKLNAGYKTVHEGTGRCKYHGGRQEDDGRIKYGRYSRRLKERYAQLVDEFEADDDPLSLLPEIAALRALFVDYIERYDETTEALLAWHDSFRDPEKAATAKKPRKVMDIADASRILSEIGKMIERVRSRKVITVVAPEVQDRLRTQIALIGQRETWGASELLEALDGVWR